MKKVVMMPEEEYSNLINKIAYLETKIEDMEITSYLDNKRFNAFWNNVNRPAIETAAEAGENDFYSWCDRVAKKYEEKDYNEWLLEKAKWYNNGLSEYAKAHACKNIEDVHEDWMWDCGYDCCIPDEYDNLPTEGWTELAYSIRYCASDPTLKVWCDHRKGKDKWDSSGSLRDYNDLSILVGGNKWPW